MSNILQPLGCLEVRETPLLCSASKIPFKSSTRRKPTLSCLLAFALLAFVPATLAETLRVATWSFPDTSNTLHEDEVPVDEAAAVLKKLDPDVILLESVRDWQTCNALVEALHPVNYTVLVCSAFRSGTNTTLTHQQVAILSKRKGYFSWYEPWRGEGGAAVPGGYAFAAIQFAKHRVGFFAVDPLVVATNRSAATHAALSKQWAQAVTTFKSWVTNRLEAVVVAGGDLGTDSTQAALTTGFLSTPLHSPVTVSVRSMPTNAPGGLVPAGLAADVKTVPGLLLLGPEVACALNVDTPKAPVASAAPVKVPTAPPMPKPVMVATNPQPTSVTPVPQPAATKPSAAPAVANAYPYAVVGGGFAVVVVVWFWSRRRRSRPVVPTALLTGNGLSSYTVVVSQPPNESPTATATVQPPIPQLVPLQKSSGSGPNPVEVWPPGPVLLSPERQRAAAQERAGLRAELAQWLKQKLLQKLLSDRSELLKTQQAATGKLLSFEERLAKLEQQLQQQNQAYEQRILELNRDLAASKEENRELIRARIAQVKAEMGAARARLLAQARAGER